jgi:hypothetical protein
MKTVFQFSLATLLVCLLTSNASLGSHGNVYNTCLLIVKERGYRLSIDDAGVSSPTIWVAEKDGYDFRADNPIELLGLIAVYEYRQPDGPPKPYWWNVDEPDIFMELLHGKNE